MDIGGTAIKHALTDAATGEFTAKGQCPSCAKEPGGVVRTVFAVAENYLARQTVDAIAIATAGLVDETGKVVFAGDNFAEYSGTDLQNIVGKKSGLPCVVENDANAAALGEYYRGAGKGCASLFMVTVGTGVGGAFIADGKILRGASCSAGELGFIPADGGAKLEDLASGAAAMREIAAAKNSAARDISSEQIFAWARQNDTATVAALAKMCRFLARGLATVCCLLNPEVIVMGGGAMADKEYFAPLLKKEFTALLPAPLRQNTCLKFAELGNDAGLVGAATLAANKIAAEK